VYTIHESIGHLGIFVSGSVARKQHGEFSSNIDFIDTLPPGLYEAVFEAKTADSIGADLISGNWVMRCERRTLDDIRALGGNDSADERRFATAARVSEINLALYRTFAAPLVRAMMSAPVAEWMRHIHPLRLQYEIFSDANPFMAIVKNVAGRVREARKPVANDNPHLALQGILSEQIVAGLNAWRDMTETLAERTFLTFYGSPLLQAAVGIDPLDKRPHRKAGKPPLHRELLQNRVDELKNRIATGGLRECLVRGMIYIAAARGGVDERTFAAIRRLRGAHDETSRLTLADFKTLLREQYFMLLIDEDATLAAIPDLLPSDSQVRRRAFATLRQILSASGAVTGDAAERLRRIAQLFGTEVGSAVASDAA